MEKQNDEIYCPECGKLIKRNFSFCPYCRAEILKKEQNTIIQTIKTNSMTHSKNKMSAVILAIFAGLFSWLYTYKKNAAKFWISISIIIAFWVFYGSTNWNLLVGIFVSIVNFGIWLWVLIDNAIKPDIFYDNYPNN